MFSIYKVFFSTPFLLTKYNSKLELEQITIDYIEKYDEALHEKIKKHVFPPNQFNKSKLFTSDGTWNASDNLNKQNDSFKFKIRANYSMNPSNISLGNFTTNIESV